MWMSFKRSTSWPHRPWLGGRRRSCGRPGRWWWERPGRLGHEARARVRRSSGGRPGPLAARERKASRPITSSVVTRRPNASVIGSLSSRIQGQKALDEASVEKWSNAVRPAIKLATWTPATRGRMAKIEKKTKRYPSDWTTEELARIEPSLPRASKGDDPGRRAQALAVAEHLSADGPMIAPNSWTVASAL